MFAAAASMICVWAGQADQRAALGGSGVREREGYAEPGCVYVLCLVDKEGRSVVFIFVFVFLGLWFLDFNFVLDMGLCSYCSCPSHPMISINVIFCFYFCF